MKSAAPAQSLLDELDARQDELLEELDRLNARLQQVIAEYSTLREHNPQKQ
jgi:hypothetical protein